MNTAPNPHPELETVVRRFGEDDCVVTAIVADPADQQQTLYGIVTRAASLVGSYYPTDVTRQTGWRVVTTDGTQYNAPSEPAAVIALTEPHATTATDTDINADLARDTTPISLPSDEPGCPGCTQGQQVPGHNGAIVTAHDIDCTKLPPPGNRD